MWKLSGFLLLCTNEVYRFVWISRVFNKCYLWSTNVDSTYACAHSSFAVFLFIIPFVMLLMYFLLVFHVLSWLVNRIGGVMVNVFASSVVDRVFEPRSGQPKTIQFVCVAYTPSTHHWGERAKIGWRDGIMIMCQSGATCLSTNCFFSELALWKSN